MINVAHLKEWHSIFAKSARRTLVHTLGSWGEQVAMSNRQGKLLEFKPRTGRLQRSTKWSVQRNPNGADLTLENATPYACPIEFGARPHIIKPRNAPYLHFFWTKMGYWVTTKKVNHPGNRPYRFLIRTILSKQAELFSRLAERFTSIAKGF
jgi:hypothetical protein